jgi:hypothetical protein
MLFVRGVGEAAPGSSLLAAMKGLSEHDPRKRCTREVNWSWSDRVQWPYRSGNTTTAIPRAQFLQCLGFSVLNTAQREIRTDHGVFGCAVYLFLVPVRLFPALVVGYILLALLGVHPEDKILIAALSSITGLPILVAALRACPSLLMATIRSVVISILWPVFFLVALAIAYAWVPFLYISVPIFLLAEAIRWLPEVWRYAEVPAGSGVAYEPSLALKILEFAGIYIGTSVSVGLIGIGLRWSAAALAAPLKIIADVSRYLGDEAYRLDIQNQVLAELTSLIDGGCELVCIVTHSLGSVIVLDALKRCPVLRLESLLLITSGSPLRRFFWHFFRPTYGLAADTYREIHRGMASHGATFDWLNLYRKSDPIGARLHLPDGRDRALLETQKPIWTAHMNYWGDNEGRQIIEQAISHMRDMGGRRRCKEES